MSRKFNVAILGATGAVGTELLDLLEERNFPLGNLKVLASERSAGKTVNFAGEDLIIEAVTESSFDDVDIVLASAGGSISKKWLPIATKSGAVSIDNSSAFRMHPDVPLIVPEVNPEAAANHKGIIANPNCTTILLSVA
ncbi:MAG: aspartate-semialdehyde dehydrogenase, partial [Pseudanabaena sp.]